MDILMAFPGMLLAIAIVATLGQGLGNVTIAVGLGSMPAYARLIRGLVLSLKNALYRSIHISRRLRSQDNSQAHTSKLHTYDNSVFDAGDGMDNYVNFNFEFPGYRSDAAYT